MRMHVLNTMEIVIKIIILLSYIDIQIDIHWNTL